MIFLISLLFIFLVFTEGNEGGRHQSRELTPEGEDMKHVIPTPPPPLKGDMIF